MRRRLLKPIYLRILSTYRHVVYLHWLLDSLPTRERGGFSPINSVSLEQAIVCNLAGYSVQRRALQNFNRNTFTIDMQIFESGI
jgi:hypothetical protein